MSRYNQYGNNYYDPVGSHTNQPSGYSYQPATTSASTFPSAATTTSGYGSSYQNYGNNAYSGQQYNAQPATNTNGNGSSTNHAASALSSLGSSDYNQSATANNRSNQYDNSWAYSGGSASNNYATNQSSSTFGRLSVLEQAQNSVSSTSGSTYGGPSSYPNASSQAPSKRSYQTAYTQQNQPARYNSPLSAVQHGHTKPASRGSLQPSPQLAQAVRSVQQSDSARRQQSASVEPSPTTVDPSQVYDNRAELQRTAQIEAERRKKHEAEQAEKKAEEAAKKAEQDRIAEQKRKEDEEKQKAAEKAAAAKKAEQEKERKRKAREEKRQSKSAATTLQQMATASGAAPGAGPPANEEEEMRAMFQKMREFNAKNPAMLAKLWEEERKTHTESPQAAKSTPASGSKAPAQRQAPVSASPAVSSSTGQQQTGLRPFQKPAVATPAKPAPPAKAATAPAAQMTPSSAPKPYATNSLWPQHKKGQLAEATAKWLMSLPPNIGKHVSNQAVLDILNSNPSYVQLCESLENLGMKFERSTLARELLKAVPDGLKAQQQPPPPKPATPLGTLNRTAAQINGSSKSPESLSRSGKAKKDERPMPLSHAPSNPNGTVNYQTPLSLSDAAREVNSMYRPSFQSTNRHVSTEQDSDDSPYFTQSQTFANDSRPPSQSEMLQAAAQVVKPEAKSMEPPPRPPADKEEAARKRTFTDLVDLTAEDSDDEGPPKKVMRPLLAAGPSNGAVTQSQSLAKPTPFNQFMNSGNHKYAVQPPGFITAQSAPGKQPIEGIPTTQQNVLVAPREQKPKGLTAEHLQMLRVKGKMLVEPIMRDRVARKSEYDSRTIATDVLLATGRHPDMRGLNGHLNNMQKLLAQHGGEYEAGGQGNRSDLSTIRWDVIDPVQPKEQPKERLIAPAPKKSIEIDPDETEDELATAAPIPHRKPSGVLYELPSHPNQMLREKEKAKKRVGRPPKQRPQTLTNHNPTSANLGDSTVSNTPTRESRRLATPASAPKMASSGAIGYKAFGEQQVKLPDGTIVKKKGRPFGWKKAIHSKEAQGLTPGTSKNSTTTAKVKTPKEQSFVEPQYQVYKCGWVGCKSELHNLDTLKKHIVRVHSAATNGQGDLECAWERCAQVGVVGFEAIGEWIDHVDASHLREVRWGLGDGPRTDHTPVPSYLNDSRGRSVTPIISPTPEPQQATTIDSNPAIKKVGRPSKDGLSKAEREVSHALELLKEQKRLVGATLERTGCVLVNEERRRGFLDDEDFEDVGVGSEHDPQDE